MTSTEPTTTEDKDFTEYTGKRVVIMVGEPGKPDADAVQREGTVVTGNKLGIMFKEKGRSTSEIIDATQVLAIELQPENEKVSQRWIKEVPLGQIRQHLADRHGFLLSVLNGMTEEEAQRLHVQQHGEHGGDLGHQHGEKPKSRREQAIADAEKEKAGETPEQAAEQDRLAAEDNRPEEPGEFTNDNANQDSSHDDQDEPQLF